MEEPRSSISERWNAVVAFLKEALAKDAVSTGQLELKAREAGLLGEGQSITQAKLFKKAKKALGIRSVRSGFGRSGEWRWVWSRLPQQPTSAPAVHLRTAVGTAHTYAAVEQALATGGMAAGYSQHGTTPASRIPGEWISGVARLDYQRAPIDVPPHRWRQFIDDCNHFLNGNGYWAERAAELGWDAISLFGCNSTGPLSYLGDAGLLWFVARGKLVGLDRRYAVIAVNGAEQVFHRRPNSNRVTLPWRLRSGPHIPPA